MNILLTSAGRRGYMVDYFRKALDGEGMVHASNSEMAPAMLHADKYVITPLIYDSTYIEFLSNYVERNGINAIIPLFDIDLPVLAAAKKQFHERGVEIVVSDYEVACICNDKWRTHCFFKEHGFNCPATFISMDASLQAIENNQLQFPVIVKPRWGMGSIGIATADNRMELELFHKKVQAVVSSSYLKYESAGTSDQSVIIQQKLSGCEYGLDVVNDLAANYVVTLVKRKLAMRNGETDSAVTENSPLMRRIGSELSSVLRHIGNLDVDCFLVDHEVYLLEMNCRFGGGYPFSHLAGANVPRAIIKWLRGQVADKTLFEIRYGVKGIKDITPIVV
jgi:carbamoyl-phosphate synthase large subunit